MTRYLISGDPLEPTSGDMIAETASLAVGLPVPDGWRVLTGNERESVIARVALRYELDLERNPNGIRFCVDGHEFDNSDSPLAGDGAFAPFRVFDIPAQDYVPGTYPNRDLAQDVADYLNGEPS
jgi:hypothetical protein